MTTLRNKSIFITLLLLLACTTYAIQGEADFKKLSKTYTLDANGNIELRVQKELTINTHLALNSLYGETFIVYNPDYQSIKFHTAYALQADGTRIEVPVNAFNEVLPAAAADAPAYNHLKEMVVTHTGLELGATIYLDYSVLTKPGYYPALDIDEIVQELSPVEEYTLTVNLPENMPFTYALNGSKTKPIVKKEQGTTQHQWKFKNIPPSSKLPFLPLNRTDAIRFTASTSPSAKEALQAWTGEWNRSMNPEWKIFTQSLIKSAATPAEKTEILQKYVSTQIGNCGVSPDLTGYKLRDVNEVLRSAYGTVAEKTNTLAAMLQEAGLEPEIAVIYPSGMAYGLKPIRSFAIFCDKKYISAVKPNTDIEFRGAIDEIWLCNTQEATQTPITAQTVENNITIETPASFWENALTNNGYIVLAPKQKSTVHFWQMDRLNSNRSVVLEIPNLIRVNYTHTIMLPEGAVLQTPLTEISLNKPVGMVNITISQSGNEVKVVRLLELKKQQITPDEYPDFRQIINTWLDKNTEELLVQLK